MRGRGLRHHTVPWPGEHSSDALTIPGSRRATIKERMESIVRIHLLRTTELWAFTLDYLTREGVSCKTEDDQAMYGLFPSG